MASSSNQVLEWLKSSGGSYDETLMGLKEFPNMGIGAVALKDIRDETVLFTIPNELLLSSTNSPLKSLISPEDWLTLEGEDGSGWTALILCMMWEDQKSMQSKWYGYLHDLPTTFDTPMFWSNEELTLLEGTDILGRKQSPSTGSQDSEAADANSLFDKIGKEQAERNYEEKVVPLLEKYPSVFLQNIPSTSTSSVVPYSIEDFHIQGSRILSRSFTVPITRVGGVAAVKEKKADKMDVDGEGSDSDSDSDSDEEEEEPQQEVMVPLADMLNAVGGLDNARLVFEEDCLQMCTSRDIKAGEQIYNTYGAPPNSHVLRKYGHVDVLPLDEDLVASIPKAAQVWPFGNESDMVDVGGDEILEEVLNRVSETSRSAQKEVLSLLIDWWLENGEEESFVLELHDPIPPDMISFTKVLVQAGEPSKIPKPKLDGSEESQTVVDVILAVLERRLQAYPTALEATLQKLAESAPGGESSIPAREYYALVVRAGEQRILVTAIAALHDLIAQAKKKRKAEDNDDSSKSRKKGSKVIR